MKHFIVYDTTGNILRTGMCPDDMFDLQKGENELIMEGIANDIKHHMVCDESGKWYIKEHTTEPS